MPPIDPLPPPSRLERDSFGEIGVENGALWGAQTQRSLLHFPISTERMAGEFLRALALVKSLAARTNGALGLLPQDKAAAIEAAAEEIVQGQHGDQFPLSVWQTGSGTQTNMNMNEVIANRASEILGGPRGVARLVHANDHVNLGQSSNDVFPTAMHLAACLAIQEKLLPSLDGLVAALDHHASAFSRLIKIGRTHLQDALPLTLGQEFSGYSAQLVQARQGIVSGLDHLYPLAIGATAVGTGLNTHPEFGQRLAQQLAHRTGLPFRCAGNKFAAIAAHDGLVLAHGACKTLAVALMKIANDIRWMGSGPRSGLGELALPENEPGSSMMPGKVNPTQCEALTMICCQVLGNDSTISMAGAMGNFELNVFKPVINHNFLQSVRLLGDGMASFTPYCVVGIRPREARMGELVAQSLMLVTALVPHLGYEKAAAIAHRAHQEGCSLKAAALELQLLTAEEYDAWVDPQAMV